MDAFRTPLKRVRGLGSARDGTGHWWMQRLTAVALVPLCLWFAWFCAGLDGSYVTVHGAVADPLNAVLLVLLTWTVFFHGLQGLQVVVEDYIHHRVGEVLLLVGIKYLAIAVPVVATMAILRIVLGG